MSKLRLGVIFGGRSSEHEISLLSATAIMREAEKAGKYEIVPIGITKEGQWKSYTGDYGCLKVDWEKDALPFNVGDLKEVVDFAFPVLHGPYGEDGTIQGLFEMLNIPYAGCSTLSSSVAMDKGIAKDLFSAKNIPQVKYLVVEKETYKGKDKELFLEKLGLPLFVKPANGGSSVGITKVKKKEDLEDAIANAFLYDRRILLERGVNAREIEVSVIGNNLRDYEVSAIGEILPASEFYDYKAKYESEGRSKLLIPAELKKNEEEEIIRLAKEGFSAIDGEGFSRIDFFIDKDWGNIYLNEINTIPGFTEFSMLPLLWKQRGVEFPELVMKIVGYGNERYSIKNSWSTDFHK